MIMKMKINEKGKEFIKSFEGLKYRSYLLPGEKYYTCGYGHTGPDVMPGYTYSKAQIDIWFDQDIEKFEAAVNKYASYNWNQSEFNALTSFAYNIGSIDQLTGYGKRTRAEIAGKWLAYCHDSTGNISAGLLRRRKQELQIFMSETPTEALFESSIEVIPNEKSQ